MKKRVYNIVVLFLAVAIFFVGAGVTIVDLCCSRCADNFISMADTDIADDCMQSVETNKVMDDCCSMKSHAVEDTGCDTHHADKGDCCKKERVSIDLDNTIYKHNLSHALVWVAASLFHNSSLFLTIGEKYLQPDVVDQISIPPRDYLSLIRILII